MWSRRARRNWRSSSRTRPRRAVSGAPAGCGTTTSLRSCASPATGTLEAVGTPGLLHTRGPARERRTTSRRGDRKAASEGSEADLAWPVWVPSTDGTLVGMEADEVIFTTAEGKRRKYWQSRHWPVRHLYLAGGEKFTADSTIVAGIIQPIADLACEGRHWDIAADLAAQRRNRSVRRRQGGGSGRAEALTASWKRSPRTGPRTGGSSWRRWRASRARITPRPGSRRSGRSPRILSRDEAEQMEAVFILSEIPAPEAADALAEVAHRSSDGTRRFARLRCGGSGPERARTRSVCCELTTDSDDRVALHAAAAIQSLSPETIEKLRDWLRDGRHPRAPRSRQHFSPTTDRSKRS